MSATRKIPEIQQLFGTRQRLRNSWLVSTSLDRRSENICVFAIIITEMEFCNIESHIFPAHFVERADHAALEDRPEPFNGLSVNCADDILTSRMVNSRVWVIFVERIVARILICAKQAYSVRDGFADEGGESGGIHVCDHARDNISLAADSADDWRFAGTDAACSPASAAFIPMPVLCPCEVPSCADFGILHS